jgi:helix-turn-helix protein
MKTLTIRQASEAIGRAPATIRRYIKSGRLPAEKEQGKFGVEFRIREEDLQSLGVVPGEALAVRPPATAPAHAPARSLVEEVAQHYVPREIYAELVMKHERLLVQYGMIRAGGQKLMEYRAESEMKDSLLAEREREIREIRERSEKEVEFLQNHLRQAEIEIEDRNIEISLLQEKARRLEMSAAGAAAVRSFDEEVRSVREQEARVARIASRGPEDADSRKINILQDWLKACETERQQEES